MTVSCELAIPIAVQSVDETFLSPRIVRDMSEKNILDWTKKSVHIAK